MPRLAAVALVAAAIAAAIALYRVRRLNCKIQRLETFMTSSFEEAAAAQTRNEEAQAAAFARVNEDVAELRRQVEAGNTEPADLTELVARIEASTARLQGVDPDPAFPVAPPVEPAPPVIPE